jgi:hypothetical protein
MISVSPEECPSDLLCTEEGITVLLSSLDITKATGPDGIFFFFFLKGTAH